MFFTKVDNFFNWLFKDLNGKFEVRTLVTLLLGIVIGIIISASLYGILLLISLKKAEKKNPVSIMPTTISDNELLEMIKNIKKDFVELTVTFSPTDKIKVLGTTVMNTVKSIAGMYYPNSKYPLFELNVNELLILCHYISDRIDTVFDKKVLKPFKNMSISQVLKMLDYYKKVKENKAIKTIKKTGPVRKVLFTILNYANPVYWIRKIIVSGTINTALTKMCLIVIDIVSDETIKVYSKRIFDEERNIMEEEINKELEEMEEIE